MNTVKIDLNKIDIIDLFESVLNKKNRLDFYTDLRNEIKKRIIKILTENNIQLSNVEISNPSKLWEFDSKDLTHIDYHPRFFSEIPSLSTFYNVKNFCIGNLLFSLKTKEFEFEIINSKSINVAAVVNDSGIKKKKPYIALVGLTFNQESLSPLFKKYLNETNYTLDEVKFSDIWFPILFVCRKTGNLFTCSCFKGYIDWKKDFLRRYGDSLDDVPIFKRVATSIQYLDNICHVCTRTTPNYIYGSLNYHSTFLVRYMPYYHLINRKAGIYSAVIKKSDKDKAENELREIFGHFRIGEKWVNETLLYNIVKEIFHDKEVIFHYRGKEMEGLEIDIWVPNLKIGFEYQGVQHFKSVEHWGGQESLKKQQLNDRKKKELCKVNNYVLIEFKHDEVISKEAIYESLRIHLPDEF